MTATKIITPTAEERKSIRNGEYYEQFTVVEEYGEDSLYPVRPGIVATYTEIDYGYLIQKTERGFRWIAVEAGEEDDFGDFLASQRAALQAALSNWHSYGGKDGEWSWSRAMAKDATAPERIERTAVSELISAEVGTKLTTDEIEALAAKLTELANAQ